MPSKGEIKSEKILVKDVFRMWFRIPEYQRPYVWGYEEINDLLDDLTFAQSEKPDSEYFLGSFVFQSTPAAPELGRKFPENDLLDGQQRLATLLLLLAVIRDLVVNSETKEELKEEVKETCQEFIYQKGSSIKQLPERTRLVFSIRESVQDFINTYIKTVGATVNEEELAKVAERVSDISVQNMAKAVLEIRKFFTNNETIKPEEFLPFLINKVLLIYVATENLEDAFRLFMILNDRGIPLRNSDILKSINLGALDNEVDKIKYAKIWEQAEGELGDDFDRFLNHIRTILVKEKARLSLLQEFEDKIYNPKEKDKATGQKKPILLHKGKDTFALIEKYLNHYKTLLDGQNYDEIANFEFDNLIKVMLTGLPATDWMPPLLRYFDKFRYERLLEFLKKLDNKFSADWVVQYTPTDRIEAMNDIIKKIDFANTEDDVFDSGCFDTDKDSFLRVLDGPVYGKRFARYLLLKLDYYYQNHDQKMHFETLSVEHILPQNPAENSQWVKEFNTELRDEWTHKLGNLVLITRRKNTSQGRLDFTEKVKKYFEKNIDTCPNSLRVLTKYDEWTLAELKENHSTILSKIQEQYGIT
jgi:uncharacterized protein with ParB-like and HNH nuclease domain